MEDSARADVAIALEHCGGRGPYHARLLFKLINAGWASVFAVNTMAFALPAIICEFQLTKYQQGLLFSAIYMGSLIGGLVWGVIGDIIGRRKTLMVVLGGSFIFEFLTSFSISYTTLFALKFLSGLLSCGIMQNNYTLINEFVNVKEKEQITMRIGMASAYGYFVQPIIALCILPATFAIPVLGEAFIFKPWRLFFILCSLNALVAFLSIWFTVSESPIFLAKTGRQEEALQILKDIYAANTGNDPESYPVKEVYYEERVLGESEEDKAKSQSELHQISILFKHPYLVTLIVVILCQLITMGALAGVRSHIATVITLVLGIGQEKNPTMMEREGLPFCELFKTQILFKPKVICTEVKLNPLIYLYTTIIGFFMASFFIPSIYLVKRFGKEIFFVLAHVVAAILISIVPYSHNILTLLCLTGFATLMQNSLTVSMALIVSRVPTGVRVLTLSLLLVGGRIGVIGGSMILPVLSEISCPFGFFAIGLVNLMAVPLIAIYFLLPNPTEEAELKAIDEHTLQIH